MVKNNQEVLSATVRTKFGKGASRRDRQAGLVPAVLYGNGSAAQHLNLPYRELAAILRAHGTNAVVKLEFDGKNQLALTKQIAIHPLRSVIEHVDLLTVRRGEKITVEVPLIFTGSAASGVNVNHELTSLEIEADPLNIPEEIEVSIDGLEAGTQILAGAVQLPAKITLVGDPEALVVNITEIHDADLGEEPADTEADTETIVETTE